MRLAILIGLLLTQTPALSTSQTKDVVEALATTLRDGYLDAETGLRLAELLEAKRARGEFDGAGSPGELASSLTNLLQAETRDRHLRVTAPFAAPAVADGAPRRMVRRPAGGGPGGPPSMVGRVEMLPGQVGYLEVRNFASENVAEFDRAMASLKGAQALIIDLRQCPGGGPTAVSHLSTYLFSKRTHLVNTMARGMSAPSERWTLESVPGPRLTDVPVYILTSKGTFSAAESFAFGLKVTGRAMMVGERTGGGGHFGNITRLPHGFDMFLPTGRTYDPRTGRGWEAEGIRPDVEVPSPDALEAAIKHYRQGG